MTSTQQKAKTPEPPKAPSEPAAETRATATETPRAPEPRVVTPPSFDPELFRRVLLEPKAPIMVSQYPASPEAIRLECLKIALGKGLSASTPDARRALRAAVDGYYAIVMGRATDDLEEGADAG